MNLTGQRGGGKTLQMKLDPNKALIGPQLEVGMRVLVTYQTTEFESYQTIEMQVSSIDHTQHWIAFYVNCLACQTVIDNALLIPTGSKYPCPLFFLINSTYGKFASYPNNGAPTPSGWENKTAAEILADVNHILALSEIPAKKRMYYYPPVVTNWPYRHFIGGGLKGYEEFNTS